MATEAASAAEAAEARALNEAEERLLLYAAVEQALAVLWILCEHLDAAVSAVMANTSILQALLAALQPAHGGQAPAMRLVAGACRRRRGRRCCLDRRALTALPMRSQCARGKNSAIPAYAG